MAPVSYLWFLNVICNLIWHCSTWDALLIHAVLASRARCEHNRRKTLAFGDKEDRSYSFIPSTPILGHTLLSVWCCIPVEAHSKLETDAGQVPKPGAELEGQHLGHLNMSFC